MLLLHMLVALTIIVLDTVLLCVGAWYLKNQGGGKRAVFYNQSEVREHLTLINSVFINREDWVSTRERCNVKSPHVEAILTGFFNLGYPDLSTITVNFMTDGSFNIVFLSTPAADPDTQSCDNVFDVVNLIDQFF